jgi:hypothetical protein
MAERGYLIPGRRACVALAAAYLLFLQALLSGFVSVASAAGPHPQDAFGNVICSSTGEAPDTPARGSHHKAADCCLPGCGQFSPPLAPAPDLAVFVAPAEASAGSAGLPVALVFAPAAIRTPQNPRAPPVQV